MAFDPDSYIRRNQPTQPTQEISPGAAPPAVSAGDMPDTGPSGADGGDMALYGTAAGAAVGTGYGAYRAGRAAMQNPQIRAAMGPAGRSIAQIPRNIGRQYMARPITGLGVDLAAMGHGLPPPTATKEAVQGVGRAAGQVGSAAGRAAAQQIDPATQQLRDFVQQRGRYAPPAGADATTQSVRNMALQRLQQAAPAVRSATGLGALLYSGGLNTNEDQQLERYRQIARERGLMQ